MRSIGLVVRLPCKAYSRRHRTLHVRPHVAAAQPSALDPVPVPPTAPGAKEKLEDHPVVQSVKGKADHINKVVSTLVAAGIVGPIGYSWYVDHRRTKRMDERFENGNVTQDSSGTGTDHANDRGSIEGQHVQQKQVSPAGTRHQSVEGILNRLKHAEVRKRGLIADGMPLDGGVPRYQEMSQILNVLRPSSSRCTFGMILGSRGIGKSTLVLHATRKAGGGVMYVAIPENIRDFGKAFGDAVGFDFAEDVNFWSAIHNKILGLPFKDPDADQDPVQAMSRVKPYLLDAAQRYRDRHDGRPPVIVFDQTSNLTAYAPEVLDYLQDLAKELADRRKMIFVFIVSNGNTLARMQSRPSYSRCGPEIEIPDIEDAEGVDYLVSQGLAQPIARSLVADLTGGRMSLMNKYLDLLKAYTPEGVRTVAMKEVEQQFNSVDFLTCGSDNPTEMGKYSCDIAKAILCSPTRRVELEDPVIQRQKSLLDSVLQKEVFGMHLDNTITFLTRSHETFARDYLTRKGLLNATENRSVAANSNRPHNGDGDLRLGTMEQALETAGPPPPQS